VRGPFESPAICSVLPSDLGGEYAVFILRGYQIDWVGQFYLVCRRHHDCMSHAWCVGLGRCLCASVLLSVCQSSSQ
jgi:hypothetical protein